MSRQWIADRLGMGSSSYVSNLLTSVDSALTLLCLINRAALEVLALRIAIYRGLEKWELMQEIAKRLAEFQPDDIQWTISLAYATRRANSIQAAKEILLSAEPKFPNEPAIKYNLACYFCQMGDIKTAKNYLKEKRGVHLISDAPPFGGLWYGEPDAISNAVG
jgi:tetratricopeptide (TPR) repeat protein